MTTCSLCDAKGVTKKTCPLYAEVKNPLPKKHNHTKKVLSSLSKKKVKVEKSFYEFENNRKIASMLERFSECHRILGETFRSRAYLKAKQILEQNVKINITSGDDVVQLKGVGIKIATKIDQLLEHSHIPKLTELESDPYIISMKSLLSIFQVGPQTAKKWYDSGIKSISDVRDQYRKKKLKLTNAQELGIIYYEDLETRISQTEMDLHKDKILELLTPVDPQLEIIMAGSFRRYEHLSPKIRKTKTSGDIDVLLIHSKLNSKESVSKSALMKRIAKKIGTTKYMKGKLTLGRTKFSMIVGLPNKPARHLDIRLFPKNSFVYSLLHFTGSGLHNQILRSKALDKGYSLSEYGLTNIKTGEQVFLKTEKEVFNFLGTKYLEPHKRDW